MNQCLTIFRFSASPYFDSVCSRQCRKHLVTHSLLILIIMINNFFIYLWFNSGGFQPRLGRERQYPYVKGCIFGASQKISWEQLVTCLAHSKEHCKTSWVLGERCAGRSRYLSDYKESDPLHGILKGASPFDKKVRHVWMAARVENNNYELNSSSSHTWYD